MWPPAAATRSRCAGSDVTMRFAISATRSGGAYQPLRQRAEELGVGKGDRVFSLLGRVPELYVVALGTLKNGGVFWPLFSAFGPEPIRARMAIGEARRCWSRRRRSTGARSQPWRKRAARPASMSCWSATARRMPPSPARWISPPRWRRRRTSSTIVPTDPEDMALLHFTSGTTGRPKGAVHVHEAVVAHHITGKYALDLHPDDIFWCTADPGWVTGTSYGIIAPLTNGVTMIVDEAEFDAERWYRILQEQRVTVWYTAPTAIRMLMKVGAETRQGYDLSAAPLHGERRRAAQPRGRGVGRRRRSAAVPRQLVADRDRRHHDRQLRARWTSGRARWAGRCRGSRPASSSAPPVARCRDHRAADGEGELALRPGWPSMLRGYLHEEERYRKCFAGGWYLTGDLAMRDADGYFWFVGRADDVIKIAGPPDRPVRGRKRADGASGGGRGRGDRQARPDGRRDRQGVRRAEARPSSRPRRCARNCWAMRRKRLGPAVAPKEIDFRTNLPRTRSGKIMRRLLKARELGLPEGDLSTLESEER